MTELERRLRRVRSAVAEGRPREARDLADRALREAASHPELAVLRGLVSHDLGRPGAGEELTEALATGGGSQADRVDAWVVVAEAADTRRQWRQADGAWAESVAASGQAAGLVLGRAGALLRAGRTEEALPHLVHASGSDDSAVALAAWLLLSGVHVAAYRLAEGEAAAERAMVLAQERSSWLAYAAAAIDLSEVRLRRQDKTGALDGLIAALQLVRQRGDPGALLVARVHEVRTA